MRVFYCAIVLVFFSSCVKDEKKEEVFPDVSHAFPTLDISSKSVSRLSKDYLFENRNYSIEEITEKFSDFIGKEWRPMGYIYTDKKVEDLELKISDPSVHLSIKEAARIRLEKIRRRYENIEHFKNEDFPGSIVSIFIMHEIGVEEGPPQWIQVKSKYTPPGKAKGPVRKGKGVSSIR